MKLPKIAFIFFLIGQILLFVQSSIASNSSKKEFRNLEELNSDIIVFDNFYNSYVPLIDIYDRKYLSGHIWVDLVKYRGNFLVFEADKNMSLFVNGKFFKSYNKYMIDKITINSFLPFSNGNHVFLSFYHPNAKWPRSIKVAIPIVHQIYDNQEDNRIIPHIKSRFGSFVIEALLLVLFCFSILKLYFRKTFYSYYTFLNYLRAKKEDVQEEILVMNVLNKEGIMYILVNCIMLSYSFTLMLHYFEFSIFEENIKTAEYWLIFGVGILIFLMIYLLKYIGIYFYTLIYKFKNLNNTHFFAFVSYWQKIGLFVFVFSLFFCSSMSVFNVEIEIYWFNFYLVLLTILLCIYVAFHIRYLLSFTNVYLFSYLCITEVLPILLIYKTYTASDLILN